MVIRSNFQLGWTSVSVRSRVYQMLLKSFSDCEISGTLFGSMIATNLELRLHFRIHMVVETFWGKTCFGDQCLPDQMVLNASAHVVLPTSVGHVPLSSFHCKSNPISSFPLKSSRVLLFFFVLK